MIDFEKLRRDQEAKKKDRAENPGPLIRLANVRYHPLRDLWGAWYLGDGYRDWEASKLAIYKEHADQCLEMKRIDEEPVDYNWWLRRQYQIRGPVYRELMDMYRAALSVNGITLACSCWEKDCECCTGQIKWAIESMWARGILPP